MFGDILLGSLGNMPFLNNGANFPTTSVRGCLQNVGVIMQVPKLGDHFKELF